MRRDIMERKLQVFISSTNKDLVSERQAAVKAILDAGHIPAGMELFKAGNSQLETIYRWIDDSDVYLLILGGRYGSIDKASKLSYTHLEYEYALSKGIPAFAIVLSEKMLNMKAAEKTSKEVFETKNKKKYQDFKALVQTKVVRYADNISDIEKIIISQLSNYLSKDPEQFVGWVKGDNTIDNFSVFGYDKLTEMSRELIRELISRNMPINLDDFTQHFVNNLYKNMNFNGILDSVERIIELDPIDEKMLKVTTTQILNYSYLNPEKRSFGHNFAATQQQAETLKVEKLLINNIDYTSEFNYGIERK